LNRPRFDRQNRESPIFWRISPWSLIPAAHWPESNRRTTKPGEHCADIQASGAVDRDAGTISEARKWTLHAGWRNPRPCGSRHRPGGNHPSRWLEVDSNAFAVCGKDQCGPIGNGEGSREGGEGFDRTLKYRILTGKRLYVVLDLPRFPTSSSRGKSGTNPSPMRLPFWCAQRLRR
jgi:hypothetical protein